MRFGWLLGVPAMLLASAGIDAAQAATTTIARAGLWDAFGGTSNNGTRVCGVSTSWTDNREFLLKYYRGDNTFTVQLVSPHWSVNSGDKYRVAMQIDANASWSGLAVGAHVGNSGMLQFEINRNQLSRFIEQFRHGDILYLSFPGTGARDWTASLEGTNAVTTSFANCILAI
ncbi:MAG TPA: hypothetical protein VFA12_10545 [Stellaceae bacterium]|nr:hypothetical protein [Stellaceae bacterium]